tara:strand:- start:88 stop:213 length:126 start_codon:yes stop_codon:yes gene_type:complete
MGARAKHRISVSTARFCFGGGCELAVALPVILYARNYNTSF